MVFLTKATALLLLSILCMVHSTTSLKKSMQNIKDTSSFSRLIKNGDRIVYNNEPKFIKSNKVFKIDNRKSIIPTQKKIFEKKTKKISNNIKQKPIPKARKERIDINEFRNLPHNKIKLNKIAPKKTGTLIHSKTKNKKVSRGGNKDNKYQKTKKLTEKNKMKIKKKSKKGKGKGQKISKTGEPCKKKKGECISKKKSCRENFVRVKNRERKYCKSKQYVCCIKSTGMQLPNKASCVSLGGKCIKKKKSCKGEEKNGAEFCEKQKRYKCCIKNKTERLGCKSKPACSSLNGECIKQNEICDGEEFRGQKYCTLYKTCKCCVKIKSTESHPWTTAKIGSTEFLPLTTFKIHSTESHPLTTVIYNPEVPLSTAVPILSAVTTTISKPNTEVNSCYQEMNLGINTHTMLLSPSDRCEVYRRGITENSKKDILKLHNHYRTKVAMGQEVHGDPGPQPAGSNIREMVWNEELAKVAQAWADQCPMGNDCHSCRSLCSREYVVGQNIYFLGTNNETQMWNMAIEGWYGEVKNFNRSLVKQLTEPKPGTAISHYTQLMWAETYEVGCGAIYFPADFPSKTGERATLKASRIYICNYGPAGNYRNRPVYKIGEAATECSNGVSSSYPALCA